MKAKDVMDALLAAWESDKLPLTLKLVLYLAVVCLLFSLAGFPVVEYSERLHRALLDNVPKLYGMFWGLFIGATIAGLAKPAVKASVKTLVLLFTGGREEGGKIYVKPEKIDDYRWALRFSAMLALVWMAVFTFMFMRWFLAQ